MNRLRSRLPIRRSLSVLIVILLGPGVLQASAAELIDAAILLQRFEQQLLSDSPPPDVRAIDRELGRLQAAKSPVVRVRQSSSWNFGEVAALGLGGSVSTRLSDPEVEAQEALMAQRLLLAQHNARSERRNRLREFRRTLRLLAHVEEVEALLAAHRSGLLAEHPEWLALEREVFGVYGAGTDLGTAVRARQDRSGSDLATAAGGRSGARSAAPPRLEDAEIGYLEMLQALERTRGERYLLARAIEFRAGLQPLQLEGVEIGRPPPPAAGTPVLECGANGATASDESVRAGLLLEEARLASHAEAARARPQVSLELSGSANYQTSQSTRDHWRGDLRASLRVLLPATKGVSWEARVEAGAAGLSQELNLSWPSRESGSQVRLPEAEEDYLEALAEAGLAATRAQRALLDARGRQQLRVLELSRAQALLASGGGAMRSVNAVAQAELALLNAQLEVDLARIEAAISCKGT